jgi:signal transduction histidine kinase
VSRAVAGKLEVSLTRVDVSEVVRHVVTSHSPRARDEGLGLSSDVEPGLRVLGDRQRLEQVFSNLVSNAIKFTPPGGLISVSASRASGMARVLVADSGEGIEPAQLEQVFDRFWQGGARVRRREGLGLGLAIVKYIVDEHGGYVRAQSAGRGHGATFVVDLPLADVKGS